MLIDHLPANFLRILSAENLVSLSQGLARQLQVGQILTGQVVQVFADGKAAVNFAGQKTLVEGQLSLRTGDTLSARVEQLSPSPVLKILTPSTPPASGVSEKQANPDAAVSSNASRAGLTIRLSSKKDDPVVFLGKPELEFLKLSPGENYQARITQIVDKDTAIAQLAGRDFQIQTGLPEPLKQGDRVDVFAEKLANGLFRFVQADTGILKNVDPGLIKAYLPHREAFGEMVPRLLALFNKISDGPGTAPISKESLQAVDQTLQRINPGTGKLPDAQMIKDQIDLSGINYEAKLLKLFAEGGFTGKGLETIRDLKGQLLDIIQKLENRIAQNEAPPEHIGPLKDHIQTLRSAVDNIEFHQLANQLAKQENHSLILQIPNPFSGGDPTLKLYVRSLNEDEAGKKGNTRSRFNLVFLLNLSALGNLRVDSQISGQQLSVKVHAENQPAADFISARSGEFQSQLANLGFNADLTCCLSEKVALDQEQDLSRVLGKDASRLVDITT